MLKALIISNNHSYVNELKRSALLSDIDILAICYGVDDVIKRLESGMQPDVIIASDVLFPGSSVQGVVDIISRANMLPKLYFTLRNTTHADYLMNQGIQYVFESEVVPQDLLDMIKKGLEQGEGSLSYADMDPRSLEDKETKGMANMFAAEQANKRAAERGEQAGRRNFSEAQVGNVNFKSIMVAVHSPKGGVGKTTLAMELAFLLAARGKEVDFNPASQLAYSKHVNVCLVDLNPSFDTMAATLECVRSVPNYPTVSEWISKIEEKVFNSLSQEEKRELMQDEEHDFGPFINEHEIRFTRDEVESLLVKDEATGLYLLPSIALPFDVEYIKPVYVRIILNQIRAMFDVTIVDTANNVSFLTTEALKAANEIFLVTTPTAGASVVIGKLIKNLNRIQVDKSKFNLVINSPNGNQSVLDSDTISQVLKLPLVSVLPFDEGVKMAHEKGIPYSIYHKKSGFTREAVKLAQQICPLWTAVQRKRSPSGFSKGGGKRLFGR